MYATENNESNFFLNPNIAGSRTEENPNNVYEFGSYFANPHWVTIDNWIPFEGECAFFTTKNAIHLPAVSDFFGLRPDDPNRVNVNSFMVTSKRCYNGEDIRNHMCKYMNYFVRYFDYDKELIYYYCRFKQLIDIGVVTMDGRKFPYTKENFISDIRTYILGPKMYEKVHCMNEYNYSLKLSYKNKSNQALQYNDTHGKIFMEISFFMNILIPLISHFVYRNKMTSTSDIDDLFQDIFQFLFDRYENSIDLKGKLFETANTTIARDQKTNKDLWEKSEIRGMDITTNSIDAVDTLVLQVMPKYRYDQNMVMYNFTSIRNTAIQYAVGIAYEYELVPLSSSKRDGEDSTSQFDKFEATLTKVDEAKFLQNKANAIVTMRQIEVAYGPFTEDLIEFYRKELSKGAKPVINNFQYRLIINFLAKNFGSVLPMKDINIDQYIELLIATKRILNSQYFQLLPAIIGGRVAKLTSRTVLNKKELQMIEASDNWTAIRYKYMDNAKTLENILATLATILSSDFQVIDYDMNNHCATPYNGKTIVIDNPASAKIIEEYLMFILMI